MIKENIIRIQDNINEIKIKNNIDHNIELMAVTKTFPASDVAEAMSCGLTLFGENRIIEAHQKYNDKILVNMPYNLHIIGHLQRNKAKHAVEIMSMVQSIDKIDTLDAINAEATKINKQIEYLIEVNTSNEPQKYGIHPAALESFIKQIQDMNYSNCKLRGLMTVGPLTDSDSDIHKSFALLKKLFDNVNNTAHFDNFDILSMGMSGDYPIAIAEGSTLVRIGSAIFGRR